LVFRKWGDCVVRVLMEKTSGDNVPMYGRIIFKSEVFVRLVLNGQRLVKITVGYRQIWLRKYVPRPINDRKLIFTKYPEGWKYRSTFLYSCIDEYLCS
jgi:hypothetical protein